MRHITPAIAAASIAAACAPSAALAEEATGIVYLDANRNAVRDAREQGIPGVAVSNGVDVAITDAEGRYRLDVDDNTIIFVIKPRGYQVALDERNLPRGYYIHKPEGSPDDDFIWKGVEPTGPLPSSVDFPLTRHDEPESFSVIAFGDPQPYSLEQIDWFRRDVIDPIAIPNRSGPDANTHRALFGISLGDLVGDQLDLFHPLNDAQSLLGVPWYNVYGNHDMNFMSGVSEPTASAADDYAAETFNRVYGPENYAFQYGRAHFIVLDNVIWQGFDDYREGEHDSWPGGKWPRTGNYRGGLRDFQLEFIDNYLDHVPSDDLVILAFHVPIEMDGPGVHRIPEHEKLFKILSSHPNTFSMSGHTHFQQHWFFDASNGYDPAANGHDSNQHTERNPKRFHAPVHHHLNAVTASGSWYNGMLDETGVPHTTMRCGAPNGYTLLHIDGNTYSTEFRAARKPADHQFAVHMPAEVSPADGATVTVNVFNGAEGDAVIMRITASRAAGGWTTAWSPMTHKRIADPNFADTVMRELASTDQGRRNGWGLPNPIASAHVWTADLPSNLPAGTHTLEIEHTDLYGKTNTHRHTFRVPD